MRLQPRSGSRAGVQRGELSDDAGRETSASGVRGPGKQRGGALLDATARPPDGQGEPGSEQGDVAVVGANLSHPGPAHRGSSSDGAESRSGEYDRNESGKEAKAPCMLSSGC